MHGYHNGRRKQRPACDICWNWRQEGHPAVKNCFIMTAKNGDGQPTKPGLRGNMTVKTACYVVCVCVCVCVVKYIEYKQAFGSWLGRSKRTGCVSIMKHRESFKSTVADSATVLPYAVNLLSDRNPLCYGDNWLNSIVYTYLACLPLFGIIIIIILKFENDFAFTAVNRCLFLPQT